MALPVNATATQQNNGASAPKAAPNPFAKAAKGHLEQGQSQVITLSAAQQNLQPFVVPAYGYLREVHLIITAVTAANAAAVAYAADAPYSVLRNIILQDSGGAQLLNLGGFAASLSYKWGGYAAFGFQETDTRFFSKVTGAVGTGGSFQIDIPITQLFMRNGVGALPNMDASSAYQLFCTVGVLTDVYTVSPTNPPAITFQLVEYAYTNPQLADIFKRPNIVVPPGIGPDGASVQYWSSFVTNLANGANTVNLTRVGNNIRGHVLVFRDNAGARADLIPQQNLLTFDWDGNIRYQAPRTFFDYMAFREYGFSTDLGVVPLMNIFDPDGKAGSEIGYEFLQSVSGTRFILRFNTTAVGTIEVLTNDVVVPPDLR